MEKNYDFTKIHIWTVAYFSIPDKIGTRIGLAPIQDLPLNEFQIFIEILESRNECYTIYSELGGSSTLAKGPCGGSKWSVITNHNELFDSINKLGKTYIRRNGEIIKVYKNFEDFYKTIKR